jgi:predicted PP-loop superfamily ATPase
VNEGHRTGDDGSASKLTLRWIALQTCPQRSTMPKAIVSPKMMRSASLRGRPHFAGARRPERYTASMNPVDGEDIGPYCGSRNILTPRTS